MAPRRRSDKFVHFELPANVEISTRKLAGGSLAIYARYVFPARGDGKRRERSPIMGRLPDDLQEIKAAATALNLKFYSEKKVFEKLLENHSQQKLFSRDNPCIKTVANLFDVEWISKQNYSNDYYKESCRRVNKFAAYYTNRDIRSLSTYEISTYLSTLKQEPARQTKTLLDRLFKFAKGKGFYSDINPVSDILRIKHVTRKRKRHTHTGVWTIYDAAPDWLQRAMGVAIFSLQRRGDLVAMHKDHNKVNLNTRTIEILQSKVDAYMEITMGDELLKYITVCIKSDIPCPYLLHKRYQRQASKKRQSKQHPFAIKPDYLTRAFRDIRDSTGIYDHLPKDERPTFHDLRAYGIFAYFKAGYSVEYIQALAGHASQKMTEHYIQGHEKRKPVKVSAGLSIESVDWSAVDWEEGLVGQLPEGLKGLISDDEKG